MTAATMGIRAQWKGCLPEVADWENTFGGAKNTVKLGKAVIDWWKFYDANVPSVWLNVRSGLTETKNIMAIAEFPGKFQKIEASVWKMHEAPSVSSAWQVFIECNGLVNPTCDVAEWVDARVTRVSWMETARYFGAGSLWIGMTDSAARASYNIVMEASVIGAGIPEGGTDADYADRSNLAWRRIGLALIELAKCVSYVAMASLILINAFFVPVAYYAFWTLLSSTVALAATVIGYFANRADGAMDKDAQRAVPIGGYGAPKPAAT